jgi:serine/threonine protein kinase
VRVCAGDFGTACSISTAAATKAPAASASGSSGSGSGSGSAALNDGYAAGDEEGDSKYMAPEVLHSRPSAASDMFSFGLTLYEIVSGNTLPANGVVYQELRAGKVSPFNPFFFLFPSFFLSFLRAVVRSGKC